MIAGSFLRRWECALLVVFVLGTHRVESGGHFRALDAAHFGTSLSGQAAAQRAAAGEQLRGTADPDRGQLQSEHSALALRNLLQQSAVGDSQVRAATQQSDRPYESVYEPPQRSEQDFRVFHDVLLRSENELLFFVPDKTAAEQAAKQLPNMDVILDHQFWNRSGDLDPFKVTIVDRSEKAAAPDRCLRWVEQPAIYHSIINVADTNIAHALQDGYIPLLYTAMITGLFNLSAFNARQEGLPTSEEANLMVLQRQASFLSAATIWMLDHLTPDVKASNQMVGSCFRTLVVGVDGSPRIYTRFVTPEHGQRRRDAFANFQEFALEATRRTHVLRNWHPLKMTGRGEGEVRTRIGFVSRTKKTYNSRGTLNEDDVIAAIRQRYDAEVTILRFGSGPGELGKAMQATHQLDVLVGIHGAGLINMLWMEPGAVVVQLLPYGWHTSNTSFSPNANLFEQFAQGAGLVHMTWSNTDPQNAFFNPTDFEDRSKWVEHPDESTPLPLDRWSSNGAEKWWQYQDTHVDIDSFMPVMDEAVRLVDGRQRAHVSPHRHARSRLRQLNL